MKEGASKWGVSLFFFVSTRVEIEIEENFTFKIPFMIWILVLKGTRFKLPAFKM